MELNSAVQRMQGRERTVRGQVIHLERDMRSARYQDDTTVSTRPPKKPSHVFFGDSLISGVRPKKKPAVDKNCVSACYSAACKTGHLSRLAAFAVSVL